MGEIMDSSQRIRRLTGLQELGTAGERGRLCDRLLCFDGVTVRFGFGGTRNRSNGRSWRGTRSEDMAYSKTRAQRMNDWNC